MGCGGNTQLDFKRGKLGVRVCPARLTAQARGIEAASGRPRFALNRMVSLLRPIGFVVAAAVAPAALAQDVEAGRKKAETCVACHGPNGNSTQPLFPILAGSDRALPLSPAQGLQGRPAQGTADGPVLQNLARGHVRPCRVLRRAEDPHDVLQERPGRRPSAARRSPRRCCARCATSAASWARTRSRASRAALTSTPVKQLRDFKTQRRTNDAGDNMVSVSKTLSEQDIDDLGHYLAGLDERQSQFPAASPCAGRKSCSCRPS